MQKPWDGLEERRIEPTDHDNLIRVITILSEHVKNFDSHVVDDKAIAKKVEWSNKMLYMGLGGIAALQLIGIFRH